MSSERCGESNFLRSIVQVCFFHCVDDTSVSQADCPSVSNILEGKLKTYGKNLQNAKRVGSREKERVLACMQKGVA